MPGKVKLLLVQMHYPTQPLKICYIVPISTFPSRVLYTSYVVHIHYSFSLYFDFETRESDFFSSSRQDAEVNLKYCKPKIGNDSLFKSFYRGGSRGWGFRDLNPPPANTVFFFLYSTKTLPPTYTVLDSPLFNVDVATHFLATLFPVHFAVLLRSPLSLILTFEFLKSKTASDDKLAFHRMLNIVPLLSSVGHNFRTFY